MLFVGFGFTLMILALIGMAGFSYKKNGWTGGCSLSCCKCCKCGKK